MKPTDILGDIKLYNADNMEVMKTFKDKQFDLAIVDPPYGINIEQRVFKDGKEWDTDAPPKEYFQELFRVSKNQIIWGGNYFDLPPTKHFVVWDKKITEDHTFSMCEFAWTSFDGKHLIFRQPPVGNRGFYNIDGERIHPTQKSVKLYKWLLQKYAKKGDTILDTHFGSLSIGIACHDMKFDLTAIELDKDYYKQAKQRLINHQKQLTLF